MKKLSAILACIIAIAAISGCDSKPANNSTSASSASASVSSGTEPVVTSDALATSDTTAATDDTTASGEDDERTYAIFNDVTETAPHFYEFSKYIVASKSTIVLDTLDDNMETRITSTFYNDYDRGIGISVFYPEENKTSKAMIYNGKYYMMSSEKKKVFEFTIGYNEAIGFDDEVRRKTFGFSFKIKGLEVSTGEGEIEGVMYDTETMTDGEDTSVYYFDKQTGEMKYMEIAAGLIRIVNTEFDCSDDAFNIPEDYELVVAQESEE